MEKTKNKNHPPAAKAAMADRGFTLVELLVVMSILAIMVAIIIGTLNPIALVNKARDSRRKNDLNKIKIAFEAYYTDKGTYPTREEIAIWNVPENCDKTVTQMKSYLRVLPCDPKKSPYEIAIINSKTFKVLTNLQNTKDVNIPNGWYLDSAPYSFRDRKNEINYGVSSSNILWYDSSYGVDSLCGSGCFRKTGSISFLIVSNDVCVSVGNILCFIGGLSGTILGVPIPGVAEVRQCYIDRCCNGSGCN